MAPELEPGMAPEREDLEDRLKRAVAAAEMLGRHLWVATVVYRAGWTALEDYDAGFPLTLDAAEVLMPAQVGCFLCELPYERKRREEPCPAAPITYTQPRHVQEVHR